MAGGFANPSILKVCSNVQRLAVPHLIRQHQASERRLGTEQLLDVLKAAVRARLQEASLYFARQLAPMQESVGQETMQELVCAAADTGDAGLLSELLTELLGSGLLQPPIDPTGDLVRRAARPSMAGVLEVLVRHGAPFTLRAINQAMEWDVKEKVLEVLLAASQPRVPLGGEEALVEWFAEDWDEDVTCPFYRLLCHDDTAGSPPFYRMLCHGDTTGRARAARKAELLLAAGYRPATYRHLVYVRVVEEEWLEEEGEEEDVVVHLRDFCPMGDLASKDPVLDARLHPDDRWVLV